MDSFSCPPWSNLHSQCILELFSKWAARKGKPVNIAESGEYKMSFFQHISTHCCVYLTTKQTDDQEHFERRRNLKYMFTLVGQLFLLKKIKFMEMDIIFKNTCNWNYIYIFQLLMELNFRNNSRPIIVYTPTPVVCQKQ